MVKADKLIVCGVAERVIVEAPAEADARFNSAEALLLRSQETNSSGRRWRLGGAVARTGEDVNRGINCSALKGYSIVYKNIVQEVIVQQFIPSQTQGNIQQSHDPAAQKLLQQ